MVDGSVRPRSSNGSDETEWKKKWHFYFYLFILRQSVIM